MKRMFALFLCAGALATADAQVTSARLQASGLTCAMCARSIYKNLETLPFVEKVDTDLEGSAFGIRFRQGAEVDADQIRTRVEDAGFSVAGLTLMATFSDQPVSDDRHLTVSGRVYHFVRVGSRRLQGEHALQVVDKSFIPARQAKTLERASRMECYRTGKAGACCEGEGVAPGTRVYHVSM